MKSVDIIVKGFLEQESHFYRRYSEDGHTWSINDYSFGETYSHNHFLRTIKLGDIGEHCFYTKEMGLLYKDIYMRVREPVSFETPYSGCVYVRRERYIDNKLWVIEVEGGGFPETKLVEDFFNKTVYRLIKKKDSDDIWVWDWDNIRAKTYEHKEEAIYKNEGWPLVKS